MLIYNYKNWRTTGIEEVEVDKVEKNPRKSWAVKYIRREGVIIHSNVSRHFELTLQEAQEKVLHLINKEIGVHERAIERLKQKAEELK